MIVCMAESKEWLLFSLQTARAETHESSRVNACPLPQFVPLRPHLQFLLPPGNHLSLQHLDLIAHLITLIILHTLTLTILRGDKRRPHKVMVPLILARLITITLLSLVLLQSSRPTIDSECKAQQIFILCVVLTRSKG